MYNANRKLKDYDLKREVYMAEARRKTTISCTQKSKRDLKTKGSFPDFLYRERGYRSII